MTWNEFIAKLETLLDDIPPELIGRQLKFGDWSAIFVFTGEKKAPNR